MSFDVHTVSINPAGSPPNQLDRVLAGFFRDIAFPASAASLTALGSITAGTGFATLPALAPSGGTLTVGVSPADPAVAIATSLKCVTATVLTPGSGVAMNDTFNVAGGTLAKAGPYGTGNTTAPAATVLTASAIQVVSATVANGGSGGTPGAVTITGTTGTGTKWQGTGTINGSGVLTGPITVTLAGVYSATPTLAGDTVSGGSLSGATCALTMGAEAFTISTAGGYTGAPPTANTPTNGTGSGTGVTATLAFGLGTAEIVHGGNYSGAPSFTVSGGGGSGASIATGTLGGNGSAIPRQVVANLPAAYQVKVQLNGQDGRAYTVQKGYLGFSVNLVPVTASTTLAAGTFDALVLG